MNERQPLKIAKALSDGTRLRLLREIAASGEISCGELANRFPVAQPTVSHHLKVVGQAGLVAARREARRIPRGTRRVDLPAGACQLMPCYPTS